MRSSIEIRSAAPSDADILGFIHSLSWRSTYRGIATEGFLCAFSPEKRAAFFARILPVTANEHYLLCWLGQPVGMLAIGRADGMDSRGLPYGEIHALYLLSAYQGRGIGRAALHFAVNRLRALGCQSIVLTVLSSNTRAVRFYAGYGFVPDGEEEPFDMGHPVMERNYRLYLCKEPTAT